MILPVFLRDMVVTPCLKYHDHFIRKIISKIHGNGTKNNSISSNWLCFSNSSHINPNPNHTRNDQNLQNTGSSNSRKFGRVGKLDSLFRSDWHWYTLWLYKKKDQGQERFVSSEYRQKYHAEHLKELIQLIENNKKKTISNSSFESLLRLPLDEKRLILQHFYVDEKHFHPHYKLYSNYKKYVGYYNSIELDRIDLANDIVELDIFLGKIASKYKKSKTWFKREEMAKALHLDPFLFTSRIAHYSHPFFL